MFVAGNDLPARFAALAPGARFHVAETGFGTGLSFVATWHAFVTHAPAQARLDFTSTEIAPLAHDELVAALALFPEVAAQAAALAAQYAALPPGWHPFVFDGGRVRLTLLIGDARRTLAEARFAADAWCLDGFAPQADARLWDDATFAHVARLSRVGTTCATWCVAGDVRRGLVRHGFEVARTPGFGRKREMLRGVCRAPAAAIQVPPWLRRASPSTSVRHAVVVGAGIAGATCAHALAQSGVDVTVVDRASAPAAGASGQPVAALHIRPSAHDTPLTALVVAGLATAWRWLRTQLPDDAHAWSGCGVLALDHDAATAQRHAQLAALGWPTRFVRHVDAQQACALADVPLATGALHFAQSGWVHGPAWVAALLADPRIAVRTGFEVVRLLPPDSDAAAGADSGVGRDDGTWRVVSRGGDAIDADVVVLANALDARALAVAAHLPLAALRGQLTQLPATDASRALRTVLCGERYATPARAGAHTVGSTFAPGDARDDVRAEDHAHNLTALHALAPALHAALGGAWLDPAALGGRAALRCVAPDRLPLVGALHAADALRAQYGGRPRAVIDADPAPSSGPGGLFASLAHGSRGFVTAPLAALEVAAAVVGAPSVLPAPLAAALAPDRSVVRTLKRLRAVGR